MLSRLNMSERNGRERLMLEAEPERCSTWRSAAYKERMSLAAWMRKYLDLAAQWANEMAGDQDG